MARVVPFSRAQRDPPPLSVWWRLTIWGAVGFAAGLAATALVRNW